MKNRLERNYSSMGQVRTGKKQLKVTINGDESGSDLNDDELTRQNLPYLENHSLRTQYLDQQEVRCVTVFVCSGSG